MKLSTFFIQERFIQSRVDYSLFVRTTGKDFTTPLVDVDDIMITKNNMSIIDSLKCEVNRKFKIKGLRDLKYFLISRLHNPIKGFIHVNINIL